MSCEASRKCRPESSKTPAARRISQCGPRSLPRFVPKIQIVALIGPFGFSGRGAISPASTATREATSCWECNQMLHGQLLVCTNGKLLGIRPLTANPFTNSIPPWSPVNNCTQQCKRLNSFRLSSSNGATQPPNSLAAVLQLCCVLSISCRSRRQSRRPEIPSLQALV